MFNLILFLFFESVVSYSITVYGDVYRDKDFFIKTLPWIVDNIGGDLRVELFLLGSGRYSVPQMCALSQMSANNYLKADYLKCEAEGIHSSEFCLCLTGIDPTLFKQCVSEGGHLASEAAGKFADIGIEVTPLIETTPKVTIFEVEDTWYLKKICTIFGEDQPRGCVQPFACNGTEPTYLKRAVAQFDKMCTEFYYQDDLYTTTTTTTFATEPAISTYDEPVK